MRIIGRVAVSALVLLVLPLLVPATSSGAAPGPAWEISSVAHPTNFSVEDNARCARQSFAVCDEYVVALTNVGSRSSSSPVTLIDALPPGLKPIEATVLNTETLQESGCGVAEGTVTCAYGGEVTPGLTIAFFVKVNVVAVEGKLPTGAVTNAVSVFGGGAPPVSTSTPLTEPNTVGGPAAAFGISAFGFAAHDASGSLDTRVGDHPYGVTTTVNLNTVLSEHPHETVPLHIESVEPPKDIVVYLPLGVLGDPSAVAHCTEQQLARFLTGCPLASRVGQITLFISGGLTSSTQPGGTASSLYNMVAETGFPAELAFKAESTIVVPLYASVVHTPSGLMLRVAAAGLPRTVRTEGAILSLYGDPRAEDGEPGAPNSAFLTNPSDCSAGPVAAHVQVDSWTHPGKWVSGESVAYPSLGGCDMLQFEPSVEMTPEVTEAEAPSGYQINIRVPQNPNQFPVLATPLLKDVTMTFPAGMMLSPGAAGGLQGCPATGPEGIDMPAAGATPTEAGEGETIGPDGMTHLTPGHCPHQSQIGTVRVVTPNLEAPLLGRVYLAQPSCGGAGQPECSQTDAADGNLFGFYLEAEGSGVVIKLEGRASVNPATGQVTAKFTNIPQLAPVSEVSVTLKGGPRAPLANPRQCGLAAVSADLAPWSSPITPDALVSSSPFTVDWDGHGAPCPGSVPFAPTMSAYDRNKVAGGFGSFTFQLTRGDREQDLGRLQVRMPPGLVGMLSSVPLCGEPQAAQGTCGESSRIGTVQIAAGSGAQPLWVTGRVYLTGSYASSPFGLSIVVPAVAGPFNLGNVVVRSRIDVDRHSGAVTITSDSLPQFRDGVPLRIQQLDVTVDRPGFIFNPTSCASKEVQATVESAQGATTALSSPFAVEGCKALAFKPHFTASVTGKASKLNGAGLYVKLTFPTPPAGQAVSGAAIATAKVELPKALPSRLTTLQKACLAAVFEANPANCPAASVIGYVRASTPVLPVQLTGPVYFVSHGGAAFPDLVAVLQGDGVRVDLTSTTFISHQGVTSSTFKSIPDVPVSSFELALPQGRYSALGANTNLCNKKLLMPTTFTAQNGTVLKQTTLITATGCPKAKTAHKARRARARGKG